MRASAAVLTPVTDWTPGPFRRRHVALTFWPEPSLVRTDHLAAVGTVLQVRRSRRLGHSREPKPSETIGEQPPA
jgi:hypothetical protein